MSEKDPIVEFVVKEFKRYEDFWLDKFQDATKAYENWIGTPSKREHDWQNAVHVPLTLEGEQTLTPRIYSALFPNEAPIDVRVEGDVENVDEPSIATKIRDELKDSFRDCDVEDKTYPVVSQAVLYGTGYAESGMWLVKRGWKLGLTPEDRIYTTLDSRPDYNFVSFFEMFPHPCKMYVWDGLPLIRRRYVDAEVIKDLFESQFFEGENLREALESRQDFDSKGINLNLNKREDYEILEYWGPWDVSYKEDDKVVTKKAVPYWIMIVNRKVKIRAIPNPFKHQIPPFIKIKMFEDLKPSWFGVGMGKVGLASQERVNKIVNQRLDNVDLVLNKQGMYDANDTVLNTKGLMVSKPGKWHKVQDVERSLRPFEFNDVTQSAYVEEKIAKDDFKEATGAVVPLQPNEKAEQHRTALGIQLLQGAAGMRFKPVLKRMEIEGIQQIAKFHWSLMQQFYSQQKWEELFGPGFDIQLLEDKLKFIPTGLTETISKELQIGQLLRFKEITVNDPTINQAELNKRIADLFGFRNMDKLIVQQQPAQMGGPIDPEMQAKIQQRKAEGASLEQIKQELLGSPPPGAMPMNGMPQIGGSTVPMEAGQ
jgi:hypothetical protein